MRKIFYFSFSVFTLLLLSCISQKSGPSESIYVDNTNGNDNNQGTIKEPLKSISEINNRVREKTLDVYFAGGQTFPGTLILKNIKGTKTNPVIIGSWGKGRATIDGGNNEALKIEDCTNLTISDLNLRGNGRKDGNISNGLSLSRTSRSKILNMKSEGFQKSGFDLFNCSNIEVRKVFAVNNGFSGINVSGTQRDSSKNIIIRDSKAQNNPGDPTKLDNHSGNGILIGVSDSVLIDRCSATYNGWDMPRTGNGPVGIWAWESSHVTIQYCASYRNKTSPGAKDGGGFDLDGGVTNSLIQYCLSYENQGAGYGLFQYAGASAWKGNVIRYCISINDATTTEGSGSIFIWNGSDDENQLSDCRIHNNIILNKSYPLISFENASAHSDFIFSNNIFAGSGRMVSGTNTGSTFRSNVWWKAGKRLKFMNSNIPGEPEREQADTARYPVASFSEL